MFYELFRMKHIAQTHSLESANGDPQPQKSLAEHAVTGAEKYVDV